MTRILAADVGGTTSRLMIARRAATGLTVVHEALHTNDDFSSFGELLDHFLRAAEPGEPPAERACLAVAGPVDAASAALTNRDWRVRAAEVRQRTGIERVQLINDFVAVAHGLDALAASDLEILQAGEPSRDGLRVALGAGTGLGVALSLPREHGARVFASEGGHTDFGPGDAPEAELWASLREEFGHVSWERLVSGAGLEYIYRRLAGSAAPSAAQVSRAALEGKDPHAVEALARYCRLYGAQAGNVALTVLPRGGVYVAGGIAPKVLTGAFRARFLEGFLDKGRMRGLLQTIPLHLVVNERVGLLGAALAAG